MLDAYIHYLASGDQYVGRTVTGLPILSPNFAILPPHFKDAQDPAVVAAVNLCFPRRPPHMTPVVTMALASVVYHRDFLLTKLVHNHKASFSLRARACVCVCVRVRRCVAHSVRRSSVMCVLAAPRQSSVHGH